MPLARPRFPISGETRYGVGERRGANVPEVRRRAGLAFHIRGRPLRRPFSPLSPRRPGDGKNAVNVGGNGGSEGRGQSVPRRRGVGYRRADRIPPNASTPPSGTIAEATRGLIRGLPFMNIIAGGNGPASRVRARPGRAGCERRVVPGPSPARRRVSRGGGLEARYPRRLRRPGRAQIRRKHRRRHPCGAPVPRGVRYRR